MNSILKKIKEIAGNVTQMAGKALLRVVRTWNNSQKETRHWLAIVSAVSVLLLFAVIFLSVRLHGVSEKLEEAQAVTAELQAELEQRKASTEQETTVPAFTQTIATATPSATATPVPTTAPAPTIAEDKLIVCIDAGHGDWDGGAVLKDANGREVRIEKDDNLRMAKLLQEALKAYDVEVVMTRETDVYLELSERTSVANAVNADVLISFHRNSFAVEGELSYNDVNGAEIWVHNSKPADAVELAERLLGAVETLGGMRNRGVKYGTMTGSNENYAINREAKMTSMIIELGFVTSASDNAAYDEKGQAYAEAMAKVIYEWLEAQGD